MKRELNPKGIEEAARAIGEVRGCEGMFLCFKAGDGTLCECLSSARAAIAAYLDVVEGGEEADDPLMKLPGLAIVADGVPTFEDGSTVDIHDASVAAPDHIADVRNMVEPSEEAVRQAGDILMRHGLNAPEQVIYRAAREVLASAPPPESASGWRDIASAPKDAYVLLFPCRWTGIVAEVGKFDAAESAKKPRPYWRRLGSRSVTDDRGTPPTHWQPLPEPPTAEGEK